VVSLGEALHLSFQITRLPHSLTRAMLAHRHHPNPSSEEEGLESFPFALSLSKCTYRTRGVVRQAHH